MMRDPEEARALWTVARALTDDEAGALVREAVSRWPDIVGGEVKAEVPDVLAWLSAAAVIGELEEFLAEHDDELPDAYGTVYAAFAVFLAGHELTVPAVTELLHRSPQRPR